jgi:hypothetical protein
VLEEGKETTHTMVNAIENEVEKTYAGIDDSIKTL